LIIFLVIGFIALFHHDYWINGASHLFKLGQRYFICNGKNVKVLNAGLSGSIFSALITSLTGDKFLN